MIATWRVLSEAPVPVPQRSTNHEDHEGHEGHEDARRMPLVCRASAGEAGRHLAQEEARERKRPVESLVFPRFFLREAAATRRRATQQRQLCGLSGLCVPPSWTGGCRY